MSLMSMQEELAALEAELQRLRDGQAELEQRLRDLRVSVTSADGLVTAVVDARGQVQRVDLDSRIYQRPDSRRLAATITATIQQAVAEAMGKVVELTRPFIPEDVVRAHLNLDVAEVALPTADNHGR